jgi:hypothetical protein
MIEPETLQQVFAKVTSYDPSLTVERLSAFENSLTDKTLELCRELNIETIDLRAGLKEREHGKPLFFPADMHLNVAGNRATADVITSNWIARGMP